MNNRQLVIYNLETNLDSFVLASAHDWIEEFSSIYEYVYVFTTHMGRTNLPSNVRIVEIGGGGIIRKARAIFRLFLGLRIIIKHGEKTDVFHHMSSRTLLILGAPIRILKAPQIIWYSHSVADLAIRISANFANLVISSTRESAPKLRGVETIPIGHGISTRRLESYFESEEFNRKGIVCVGRVVKIKRIEELLFAISDLDASIRLKTGIVRLIGPYEEESNAMKSIMKVCTQTGVKIDLTGPISYSSIPKALNKASVVYTGTPKSADKAALEAAMLGCLILTTNKSVQELTGMNRVFPSDEMANDLSQQLTWMLTLPDDQMRQIRKFVANKSRELNSLDNLVRRIEQKFVDIRNDR